jgi:hypothetical protein
MTFRPLRSTRGVAACLAGVLALASVPPAHAIWHPREEFPGMVSNKSIALIAIAGGGAVGGLLLYRKFRGGATKLEVPRNLEFSGTGEQRLVAQNKGKSPINITQVSLQGEGFELSQPPKTPAVVSAGTMIEVPVRMTRPGKAEGRIELVFVENGEERTKVIKLRGKPERVAISVPAPGELAAR